MVRSKSAAMVLSIALVLAAEGSMSAAPAARAAVSHPTAEVAPGEPAQAIGTNVLVSVKANGRAPRRRASQWSAVSADGNLVVFQSEAHGLVEDVGRTGGRAHVYLRDLQRGVTTVVDARPDGKLSNGTAPLFEQPASVSISADGRFVVFTSTATNLVSEPTLPGYDNVYLRDVVAGTTTLVSRGFDGAAADAQSSLATISADGTTVVFTSHATNVVVDGPPYPLGAVYSYDLATRTVALISKTPDGDFADDSSQHPSVSADGQLVAYDTFASDIVDGEVPSEQDAVLYDVRAGTSTLLSRSASGDAPNAGSNDAVVTADGSAVVFASSASNIVEDDDNGRVTDIFRYDVATGLTTLLTHSPGGESTNASSGSPAASADGQLVAFYSYARNLVPRDRNKVSDVFVVDVRTGVTTRVSTTPSGRGGNSYSLFPAIASDGSTVSYSSRATDIVRGTERDTGRMYAYRLS